MVERYREITRYSSSSKVPGEGLGTSAFWSSQY